MNKDEITRLVLLAGKTNYKIKNSKLNQSLYHVILQRRHWDFLCTKLKMYHNNTLYK